jgi:hypothetical protein
MKNRWILSVLAVIFIGLGIFVYHHHHASKSQPAPIPTAATPPAPTHEAPSVNSVCLSKSGAGPRLYVAHFAGKNVIYLYRYDRNGHHRMRKIDVIGFQKGKPYKERGCSSMVRVFTIPVGDREKLKRQLR